ncbi:response regulator transcription factor [Microbacterium sp. cf332]|uniref:response regulator transcription factor n=1 Tax=Microbacterium sp. cf332 TaxID=1761804 RepID=UPI000889FF6E|nr:response regulator transcription factor [Microbacterium sp. cf332]SDQ25719.1 DNA-binding response regulator, NarL/FixJ family, contains REC and HTH domains [Microbacterium sp. cf332]
MNRPTERIRVLIADDNRVVRRGLRLQLEGAPGIHVVGEVANGVDAVRIARAERADVVLMDIQMPELSGIAATRLLARPDDGSTAVSVIVMTSFAVEDYVRDALDAGAIGYLLKSHDSDQLLGAVYAASRGEAIVSSRVTAPLLREFVRRGGEVEDPEAQARLTAAERRVISALAGGVTSNEGIAESLQVSVHTVRSHLHSALRKLELADRTQLALWGARNRV